MAGDRRLWSLAAGHLGLGLITSLAASVTLPDPFGLAVTLPPYGLSNVLLVPFLAVAFCQAVLIALWGASSGVSPWVRKAGLVAGPFYLEALFHADPVREFAGMSTIAIIVTTAAFLAMRARGVRLTHRDGPDPPATAGGLRFSIRGLMLFTAAVALLGAGARALRESSHRSFLLSAVWALVFVAAGLAATWAMLGKSRSIRRGPIAFALSSVLGALFAFATDFNPAGQVYIILTMLVYPTLLLGSLLIVRSCGYRMGPGPSGSDPFVPQDGTGLSRRLPA